MSSQGKNRYVVLFFRSCGLTDTERIPNPFRVSEWSYNNFSPTGRSFASSFITWPIMHSSWKTRTASILDSWATRSCSMHIVIKYISGLSNSEESEHAVYSNANLDAHLTPSEKSKRTAWFSHAGSHSDDLVVCFQHVLFKRSLVGNTLFMQLDESDAPLQVVASMFPVPKKTYILRLDAVGLVEFFCRGKGWRKVVPESTEMYTYWRYQVEHDGVSNV